MVTRLNSTLARTGWVIGPLLCLMLSENGALAQTPPGIPEEFVSLKGQVVDALSGEPIRQVALTLTIVENNAQLAERRDRPPRIRTTSDSAGNFLFRNLPPGRYQLQGEKTGYVMAAYSDRPGQIRTLLSGKPGQDLTGIVFKLIPQGVIAGKVLDEFGEPMANASLRLLRQMDYFPRIRDRFSGGGTNALGEYLIGDLPPGRYILFVEPNPGRSSRGAMLKQGQEEQDTYIPTYYPGTADAEAAASIQLGAGQQVRGIDVWLQKGRLYRISGQVSGLEPHRINLIPVSADEQAPRRPFQGIQNDRDGGFVISGVLPGEYQLMALRFAENGPPQYLGTSPVSVRNRDVEGLVVQSVPLGPISIAGRITMEESGGSLSGAGVGLQRLGPPVPFLTDGNTKMQEDGVFTIENISPGKYSVNVSYPEGDTWYVKRITAGPTDVLRDGLDLTQSGTIAPLDIVISPEGGMIQGVVREGDAPRAGACLTLFPETLTSGDQRLRRGTNSDESGQFVIRNVAPGNYRLFAWEQRFSFRDLEEQDLQPYQSSSVRVRVEENASQRVEVPVIPLP